MWKCRFGNREWSQWRWVIRIAHLYWIWLRNKCSVLQWAATKNALKRWEKSTSRQTANQQELWVCVLLCVSKIIQHSTVLLSRLACTLRINRNLYLHPDICNAALWHCKVNWIEEHRFQNHNGLVNHTHATTKSILIGILYTGYYILFSADGWTVRVHYVHKMWTKWCFQPKSPVLWCTVLTLPLFVCTQIKVQRF